MANAAVRSAKPRAEPGPRATTSQHTRKRVGVYTLGCKVNAFESELIAQTLGKSEWTVVDGREFADLYIINTCTVTKEADRQARQAVRRAVRRNPDAHVIVTGCYAQISPQACASIPGVDLVVGNDRKIEIPKLVPFLVNGRSEGGPEIMVGDLDRQVSLPDRLLSGFEGQTRAFMQVQQGCNQGCTFCIIHRARGPSRSLPPAMVKRQMAQLIESGYKEVVICGVDLGSYGADLGTGKAASCDLVDLLTQLHDGGRDYRVRLSSIDPAHIEDRLISLLATDRKLCPHLHLSLQSGSTLMLKRMKRRYSAEDVRAKVIALRSKLPELVLSADIMVGFPTEGEDEFLDTMHLMKQLDIAYPHVFPYSEREGTPAARIPADKQVAPVERKRRARKLRELGAEIRGSLLRSRLGSTARVLVEGGYCPLPGYQKARAADYIEAWVPVSAGHVGGFVQVEYESVQGHALIARVVG